jgi:hypothetical protein
MINTFARTAVTAAALLGLSAGSYLGAETPIERSSEVRFQLDLKVPDTALAALLPQGWTPNVSTQGAARDCNVRAIFIDRVTINDPKGASLGKGSNRFAYLVAPVKNPAGENVQMVIAGLTEDPADAPGQFGNYLAATTHSTSRTSAAANNGPIIDSQDWVFAAATGEHLELHIKFERGNASVRPAADTKYYSAKNPTYYQISKQEQVLDILRNTTTNPPDRVKEFSFKCGGGSYAKLCDGTEKVLSWDNVLWLNRTVSLP